MRRQQIRRSSCLLGPAERGGLLLPSRVIVLAIILSCGLLLAHFAFHCGLPAAPKHRQAKCLHLSVYSVIACDR